MAPTAPSAPVAPCAPVAPVAPVAAFMPAISALKLPSAVCVNDILLITAAFVFARAASILVLLFVIVELMPVKSERFAFRSKAACVAVLIGLFKSLVLSTLPKPKFTLAVGASDALVPPCAISITAPFHTPLIIVPTTVISVPTNLLAAIDPGCNAIVLATVPSKTPPPSSVGMFKGNTVPLAPVAPVEP